MLNQPLLIMETRTKAHTRKNRRKKKKRKKDLSHIMMQYQKHLGITEN